MRVVIAGATGLIGKALCDGLSSSYEIVALSRNPQKAQAILSNKVKVVQWDAGVPDKLVGHIEGAYAVINLAGENIASGRWTPVKMEQILQSRLDATNAIVRTITSARQKPDVFIQASAIGYYGIGQQPVDEIAGQGSGFLAEVCKKCEQQAKPVEDSGTRTVIIRTGLVLSQNGGALPQLITPFKFFLGGYPGTGYQFVSWITIDDEVAAIRFLIENRHLDGVFNLTTPNPLLMKELCRTLARILHRPCWLPIPALVLRLALGIMADEILLSGQCVMPNRLLKTGFTFAHPAITEALEFILGKGKK